MGAAEDGDAAAAAAAAAGQQQNGGQQQGGGQGQGQQSGASDKGFPENTPVAEMTHEQRANYFKHQNRQTDNKLSAFKGVTPEQVQEMQQRLQQYDDSKLKPDEKVVKDARTEAAKQAKDAADAEWSRKYLRSEVKSIAAGVIKDRDQLGTFMEMIDPTKFANEAGEVDEEMVMGKLTAMFGGSGEGNGQQQGGGQQAGGQQQRNWGQHSGGAGAVDNGRPGDAGRAEAARRKEKQKQH